MKRLNSALLYDLLFLVFNIRNIFAMQLNFPFKHFIGDFFLAAVGDLSCGLDLVYLLNLLHLFGDLLIVLNDLLVLSELFLPFHIRVDFLLHFVFQLLSAFRLKVVFV